MMRMSPQTVGLITFYLVMNVLSVCMPMENQHTHDQTSAVFLLLRRFWPFINPARPIAEPVTAIKYFHTSPRHNSRFLYAKKRRYPEELRLKPFISRNDFGIQAVPFSPSVSRTKKTVPISNFKNGFPYPAEISRVFLPHADLNSRRHLYLQQKNTNYHNADIPSFLYNNGVKRNSKPNGMLKDSYAHSTKYEEIDLPQNKILDKLKRYNPIFKLSRRVDLPSWNREDEPIGYSRSSPVFHKDVINLSNKQLQKLPLQNNKNYPHFLKPELQPKKVLTVPSEDRTAVSHSRNAVWPHPLSKPVKHFTHLHPSNIPAVNYGSDDTFLRNLRNTSKSITSSEQLHHVYNHLRWNSTCISLRNSCLFLFDRDNDGNQCLSIYSKIDITDKSNATLNHILKNFGKPCRKTELTPTFKTASNGLPVTESVPQKSNTNVFDISPKSTSMRYTNFTSMQRKSRMLKVIEEDFTTSAVQSLETSTSYALRNATAFQDTESGSFSPNNTVSLVDKRNGDYIAYVTDTPLSEPDIFSESEADTVHYSVSLLPNTTPAVERNSSKVPDVTERPNLSTSETVQNDTTHDSRTSPLDKSEDPPMKMSDDDDLASVENADDSFYGSTPKILSLRAEEHSRRGKMTGIHGSRNKSVDRSMNFFGRRYRTDDYDSEMTDSATEKNIAVFVPEFKPGSLSNFSITFRRQPIKHMSISDIDETTKTSSDSKPRRYFYSIREKSFRDRTTQAPDVTGDVRVIGSTFFPNRVQKVSLHFGKKNTNSSTHDSSKEDADKKNSLQEEGDFDEGEEIPAQEVGFTMEKLAYMLIGTCCCLSIICLLAVIVAIKCRRILVERRLRNRLFRHNLYHSSSIPWQQHIYDPFLYINGRPPGSLSSRDSCNCRCVTWTLGARNLDTRPICPTRSSIYLTGRKNLPFGAASTLCYETMIQDRRKLAMRPRPPPRMHPKSEESSNENDSLDPSSDADNSPTNQKRCTCIHPSWDARTETSNTVYNVRPATKPYRKKSSGCPHNSASHPETGTTLLNGDCPPPVSGSDYLDRTDGVVYWSSNDERLI